MQNAMAEINAELKTQTELQKRFFSRFFGFYTKCIENDQKHYFRCEFFFFDRTGWVFKKIVILCCFQKSELNSVTKYTQTES